MMKRLVWLASIGSVVGLLILLSAIIAPLESQAQDSDWVWANYTHDKDVWALAPGVRVLWAGTWGGLLRWDLWDGGYTKFTPADGLTGTFVSDIAVDSQGRAWVGHDRGLSVCDGTSCTTYDTENSDIPGEYVTRVVAASDGRVWLHSRSANGTWGEGVTVYDGLTWTTYTTADGLADNDVRSMAEDLNGHLWFGHWDGDVSRFDGSNWTTYHDIDLNYRAVTGIAVDNLNRKWFITLNVVIVFDGTNWTRYYPLEPLCPYLQDIAVDGEGRPWVASLTGLWTFDGANWTRYQAGSSGLLSDSMRAVAAQGEKVWVGYADSTTADGLTQFDGTDWSHYETPEGFPINTGQFGAAADREGRVWFGASVGAVSFDCLTWTKYDSENSGLSADLPYTIIKEDRDGHLWFAGKSGGGLVEYDGATWTQHCAEAPNPGCSVQAVAVDEDNRIWVGSQQFGTWRGLSMFDGSNWTTYNSSSNPCLASNVVGALAIDGQGNKWVGCTTRFHDATDCTTHGSVESAIQDHFTDILGTVAEDPGCWVADPARNLVWVGKGASGVSAYDGDSWTAYSLSAMDFPDTPYGWGASLAGLDADGNLWARVRGSQFNLGGVTRFDGADWTHYTHSEGVLEVPYDMAVDSYGRVWFTSQSGVNMFYDPWQTTQVTVTVDPAADGRLTSMDCSTCVTVDADSVSQDTIVTYSPMAPSATDPLGEIGHFFDLSAVISGTTTPVTSFTPNYNVSVGYAGENTEAVQDDTLGLYWWEGGQWNLEPTSAVDTVDRRVTAGPSHMTLFAVLGEPWKWTYVPLVLKGY
jgi:ligand-binding sensor domain-containing protein